MGDAPESVLTDLETEYCPPLDPALFAAIANDYDISDPNSLIELRETLDTLKASAAEQENTAFDPSGTSGTAVTADTDGLASEQSVSQRTLGSLESNIASLESELSSLSLDRDGSSQNRVTLCSPTQQDMRPFAEMGLEGKTDYLIEMFPSVDQFTVVHTLKKCGEDVDRTMDELLNLAFFEDTNDDEVETKITIPKGVDGFQKGSASEGRGRKKRRNKKHKGLGFLSESDNGSLSSADERASAENKWATAMKDVDFICSRTYLSSKAVSSTYHSKGASLPATVHALASAESDKHAETIMKDPVTITQIAELQQDFTSIPPEKLAGLLRLARNSISAANELAKVMITAPTPIPLHDIVKIIAPPIDVDQVTTPRTRQSSSSASSMSPPRGATTTDYNTSHALATSHLLAGQSAFSKAHSAYRRGRSDPLMSAAAGYYSSVGRDHIALARRESAAAADAYVTAQSSARVLDLHGVSVQDAVRIASQKVAMWWDSLGDEKFTPGKWGVVREGFRIVTGLGRHSRNGLARLGPAVARSLAREGWKVEVGTGELVVTGAVRRG
ncbi:hypothetical protein AJ80_06006 [Polytolypa hystricis UAMH7299]|uniref:Smr domain-containing protein n=1 Tax=Polytolypa hystricis (strain UAMH7299) TaxID=1447883 RepID=A0A2B7XYI2_POLH7|nr:hypothetical protein AJ80_06006 [Polytolypa hystricis UAMH7299]